MISLIAAMDLNGVIGKNQKLPWRLPADLRFFKQKTLKHSILMGRKTYESIGRPLPQRKNYVVTHQRNWAAEGICMVSDLHHFLSSFPEEEELFIIGGAEIYAQTLDFAQKIYLTQVQTKIEGGDAFFPSFDRSKWILVEEVIHPADEENAWDLHFQTFLAR